MKFVIGRYKRFPSAKQTAKQVANRVANIHGYSVQGYHVKHMTETQYRKKYKIGGKAIW